MEPEMLTEIESTLWKNLIDLSDVSESSCEYLRGYFCACEDLAYLFSALEESSEACASTFRAEKKRLKRILRDRKARKFY